nr:hypothetical protein [Tanacetum cinerariifolium]
VVKTKDGLVLSQRKYTLDILNDCGKLGCKPSTFPIEQGLKLDKEAEYRAMASTVSEVLWVRWLLSELRIDTSSPTPLFYDNQAARHIANNPVFHERTKHVEMDCYFVRERVDSKEIVPMHISSKLQIADLLTKGLTAHQLQSFDHSPYSNSLLPSSAKKKKEKSQTENIQPVDKGLPSTISDEGSAKTTPLPEGLCGDKDSGGMKPPADMEPHTNPIADPLGTDAKYQADQMQSARLRYRSLTENKGKTSSEDEMAQESDDEEVFKAGKDMEEDTQADEEQHQSPPPNTDKSKPSPDQETQELESGSSSPKLKIYDNILPLTERQLVKYLKKTFIEGYYEENVNHMEQTNKVIDAAMNSLDKNSIARGDLLNALNGVTETLKNIQDAVKEDHILNKKVIEATKAYAKNSTHLTELLTLIKNFDFQGLKSSVESLQATALKQEAHLASWAKSSTSIAWNPGPRMTGVEIIIEYLVNISKSKNDKGYQRIVREIKDVKFEDVSLTCNTPLEVFNNEVSRLSRMDDDSEHEADDDMGYDLPIIRRDDEVKLIDEEFFDYMDEVAEASRIDTNLFKFETPMCKAFNEFNYLLKIDLDLLTKDIEGFKTYEDYKNDWIYEWNMDVPWVDEKPWTNAGVGTKPTQVKHACKPFNYKTGCSEWPTYYEWYEALEDSELKDEALRNKAIMDGFMNDDDESRYEQKRRWNIYANYDDGYEIKHKKHKPKRKHTQEYEVPLTESSGKQNLASPSNDPLPSGKDSLKLKELKDLCTNLSNKVLELENDVIDIKSTYKQRTEKLECMVERLEEENRVLKELKSVHSTDDADEPVIEKEKSSKHARKIIDIDVDVEINLEKAQAVAYNLDLDHQEKVLSMMDVNEEEPANVEEVLEVVKAAKLMIEVVTTAGATKRKPLTQAQAKRNMIVYLKNMTGFKMDYFKRMTYDKIGPLFKKHYNFNQTFQDDVNEGVKVSETKVRQKEDVEVESSKREGESLELEIAKKQKIEEETEELKKHLQIVTNDDDVYTDVTPLASKIPIVDNKIHTERNRPYFKIIKADGNHMLFISFSTMLKNFDREHLESLWKMVRDRFEKTKPKNYSDDYFLNTFKIMFEKPNIKASVWKDQKGRYGLTNVKSWKLTESCGVHCITFSTTQIFLLFERMYLLTHFTLVQMLNNVRLQVENESEMSLELLRLVKR